MQVSFLLNASKSTGSGDEKRRDSSRRITITVCSITVLYSTTVELRSSNRGERSEMSEEQEKGLGSGSPTVLSISYVSPYLGRADSRFSPTVGYTLDSIHIYIYERSELLIDDDGENSTQKNVRRRPPKLQLLANHIRTITCRRQWGPPSLHGSFRRASASIVHATAVGSV